jgi:cytochrome c
MNSFELNKILGAILGTCLVLQAVHIAAGAIFTPTIPAKPGYEIAVKEETPAEAGPKTPEQPFPVLLASANPDHGKSTTRLCQACHTLDKGGPNRVGPNLWGVVGRKRASEAGYDYSSAMKAKGGTWTFDELNKFLAGPQKYIPGTKMTFAGVSNDKQRADLIAYLRTQSDNPLPLPKPPEVSQANKPNQPTPPAGAPKAPPPTSTNPPPATPKAMPPVNK